MWYFIKAANSVLEVIAFGTKRVVVRGEELKVGRKYLFEKIGKGNLRIDWC